MQMKHAMFERAGWRLGFLSRFYAAAVGSFPAGRRGRIHAERNGPIEIQRTSSPRPVSIRPHCARLPARTGRGGQLGFISVTVDNGEGERNRRRRKRQREREGKKKHRMGRRRGVFSEGEGKKKSTKVFVLAFIEK